MSTPDSRGWAQIYIAIVLIVLTTIAAILRFVAKSRRNLELRMDDGFSLGGLFMIYIMFIDVILFSTIGNDGKQTESISVSNFVTFLKIFLSNQFLFAATSPIIKISIILFYRQVFITPRFRMAADVLISLCILWGMAGMVTTSLVCRPLQAFWNPSIAGQCFNNPEHFTIPIYIIGSQTFNIALDLAILCMPIWMIWNLQVDAREKIALTGVFVLGAFAVIASIMRLVSFAFISPEDPFYTYVSATIWTFVEPCIGLICGCLPTIRGLFPAWKRKSTKQMPQFQPRTQRGTSRVALNPCGRQFQDLNIIELESDGGRSGMIREHDSGDEAQAASL